MKTLLSFSAFSLFCVLAYAQEPVPALELLKKYPNTRDFTISKDGREAWFTLQDMAESTALIVEVKNNGKKWTGPMMMSFGGKYRDIEPFLTADGKRLYFSSNRPKPGRESAKDYDIWYVERKAVSESWSEPINVGVPVNTEHDEFYPTVAANGNLYYTSDAPGATLGKDDIFSSTWNGKQYAKPLRLPVEINSAEAEFNAFIAPDESYILYTVYNKPGGLGSGDLYINFRKADGGWYAAQSLGQPVNTKFMEYCPFVDSATGTLYFTSRRNKVSPREYSSAEDFMSEISKYENGISKLYKVPFAQLVSELKQKSQ